MSRPRPGWPEAVPPPAPPRIGAGGWARIVVRGLPLMALVYGGLVLLMLLRLIEAPLFGLRRPVTPWITLWVCRGALVLMGIRLARQGLPMRGRGAMVANHSSWLDIFALNGCGRVYFVAKDDVAGWPLIGWLARATGTLFIRRLGAEAKRQEAQLRERLGAGQRLLFFPEGTSSDGLRVLPFKTSLFAAFFGEAGAGLQVQPVSLRWTAPEGEDPAFYGWWGDMEFAGHFLTVLSRPRRGRVAIRFHPPLDPAGYASRKDLAQACEQAVRDVFEAA